MSARAKPGPKPSEARHALRELFSEWSDRTFATYWRAWKQLADMHQLGIISDEEQREINRLCARPNGSFNVCKFARIAEARVAFYVASLESEP